jgi:membrane complex biogenesis BtpA family protein
MNRTPAFLRGQRALIGMVHVAALPGSPAARLSVARLAENAAREAAILAKAGYDAVIIENMHDRPYVHQEHGPEVASAMTAAAMAVRSAVGERLPVGIQVLSGGNKEALAVALAADLQFIRCENFVFSHVADEGLLGRAEAGPLLRYRRQIGAEHVAVLCDIKKKHASHAITADVPLADAAAAAEFFGADGVIVTGPATGRATSVQDVAEAAGATRLPVLVGSGATPESVGELLEFADALIVGSWNKRGGRWENPVEPGRARAMVVAFRAASRRARRDR